MLYIAGMVLVLWIIVNFYKLTRKEMEEDARKKTKKQTALLFALVCSLLIGRHIYWYRNLKCIVPGCRNDKSCYYTFQSDYCLEHACKTKFCPNPKMEGSDYCEEDAYCFYSEDCKELRYGDKSYCEKHVKIAKQEAAQEAEEKTQKRIAEEARKRKAESAKAISQPSRSRSRSSRKNGNPYASYDRGYEDVYDGDYDDRRYRTDSQYASGVDEAIDELGDDW